MRKNPYDKLNDIEIPYDDMPLDEHEKETLEALARKYAVKKSGVFVKQIAFACIAIMLCFGLSMKVPSVNAAITSIFKGIQTSFTSSFEKPDEVKAYTTSLHQPIDIGNGIIQIEELALDADDLYMTILIEDDESDTRANAEMAISAIELNGEKIEVLGSSGYSEKVEKGSKVRLDALRYSLENAPKIDETKDKQSVKLYYYDASIEQNLCFEFTIDTKKFIPETKMVLQDFKVPKTDVVIKSLRLNALSQKIIITHPENKGFTEYQFVGKTNTGQQIAFMLGEGSATTANLYFFTDLRTLKADTERLLKETTSLTLQLQKRICSEEKKGFESPFKDYGEPFTVTIK